MPPIGLTVTPKQLKKKELTSKIRGVKTHVKIQNLGETSILNWYNRWEKWFLYPNIKIQIFIIHTIVFPIWNKYWFLTVLLCVQHAYMKQILESDPKAGEVNAKIC